MIAGFDGIVSPSAGVGGVAVPEGRLYLTPGIVVVHVVDAVQTDLGDGSTPGFEQAEPCCVSGSSRVQKNHGGILGGGNHGINREPQGSTVGDGAACCGYLNRENPDGGSRWNGKGDRLVLAVSKHERPGWLRGHAGRESRKCQGDSAGEAVQCGNGNGCGGTRRSQSCAHLGWRYRQSEVLSGSDYQRQRRGM